MINIVQIALGVLIGTSLMTLFSYIMTYEVKEQFREPQLLNELINRSDIFGVENSRLAGWFLHYGVGTIFVIIYHFVWKYSLIGPSLSSGTILGFVSGLIGITGWYFVFRIHHNPPAVDIGDYFIHLIVAHIIFGAGAYMGYNLLQGHFMLY